MHEEPCSPPSPGEVGRRSGCLSGSKLCGDGRPRRPRPRSFSAPRQTPALSGPGPIDSSATVDPNRTRAKTGGRRERPVERSKRAAVPSVRTSWCRTGEGRHGTVWVAEQPCPVNGRVALKVIKAGMDPAQSCARFEAERQCAGPDDHTNLAKFLRAGTTAGRADPNFVMNVNRCAHTTYSATNCTCPLPNGWRCSCPSAGAPHAHQKGIIHRDVNPPTSWWRFQDCKPVPKVIDFRRGQVLCTHHSRSNRLHRDRRPSSSHSEVP